MKRLLFLVLILVSCGLYAQSVGPFSPQEIGGISSILSPVKFGGKKLPSWLNSEYSPITNGINSYASTTALADSSPNYTVMAWLKPYGATANGRIFSSRASNASASFDFYQATTSTIGCSVANATFTTQAATPSTWIHAAVVKTGASASLYINSVLRETKAVPAGQALFEAPIAFGRHVGFYGNGSVAEAATFNRALSDSDIARYYLKRLKGTETGLVALYHMSDNAQTLKDSGPYSRDAVCSNTVQFTKRKGYAAPDVRSERYAISLDGIDDYGTIASEALSFAAGEDFTVLCFQRLDYLNIPEATSSAIIGKGANASLVNMWRLVNRGGTLYKGLYVRSGYTTSVQFDTVPNAQIGDKGGRWSLFGGGRKNGADPVIIVDGVSIACSTASGTYTSGSSVVNYPVFVGNYGNGVSPAASTYYRGKLCELSIFSRSLSDAEIALIAAGTPANQIGSCTGYWPMNEGTGATQSIDLVGNRPITWTNSPTWVGRDIP